MPSIQKMSEQAGLRIFASSQSHLPWGMWGEEIDAPCFSILIQSAFQVLCFPPSIMQIAVLPVNACRWQGGPNVSASFWRLRRDLLQAKFPSGGAAGNFSQGWVIPGPFGKMSSGLGLAWSRFPSNLCCPVVLGSFALLFEWIFLRIRLSISCPV